MPTFCVRVHTKSTFKVVLDANNAEEAEKKAVTDVKRHEREGVDEIQRVLDYVEPVSEMDEHGDEWVPGGAPVDEFVVWLSQGQGSVEGDHFKTLEEALAYIKNHEGKASFGIKYPDGSWYKWE